jgi:DNA-binding protein HU-beta
MAINKAELVEKIHEHLGGTKVQAERVMDLVIDTLTDALKRGDDVSIAGLGIFTTATRKARTARNPRTGETIQVPSMRVPKFRPAKSLKDAVKK